MIVSWLFPLLTGFVVALLVGAPLIPALRRLRARQIVSLDAPAGHQTKTGTPTMGGLAILAGVAAALLLHLARSNLAGLGAHRDLSVVVGLLAVTLAFGAIGLIDDLLIVTRGRSLGLKARQKLAMQIIVAIAFVTWHHTQAAPPPQLGGIRPEWQLWLRQIFQVTLLVGMSNATNLTDGLDGLLAGVSVPIWGCLGFIAWSGFGLLSSSPQYGVMVLCLGFTGASLGYLWYNAHPAQVFMGDTGSLAIGGAMAAAAISLDREWVLVVAALVPIAEALSVIAQVISFQTTGKRIFKMAPVHHHFELIGWPETRIVARFAIVSAICSLAALLLMLALGAAV